MSYNKLVATTLMKLFLIFLVVCSYEIKSISANSVFALDPAEESSCINDDSCPTTHRCLNNACVSTCYGHGCVGPNTMCLPIGLHYADCVCSPGFMYNEITNTCEEACVDDKFCDTREECKYVDGSHFKKCVCRDGYVPDLYVPHVCRWRCTDEDSHECGERGLCRRGVCIDRCNYHACPENHACLKMKNIFICLDYTKAYYAYGI